MRPDPSVEPPARILVVDDKKANLVAYDAVLGPLGQPVVAAHSGSEALQHLLRESFAVVVIDVMMPELDGFGTIELLRKREATRDLPVIFVTAYDSDVRWTARAYDLGAVDILYKPFDPSVLKAKVRAFVSMFQRARLIERQQKEIAYQQARAEHADAMNRAKDEFLALVSHELRTPLMAISGWADFLRNHDADAKTVRRAVDVISRSARHQGKLVDDLLDVSRIVTGKLDLRRRDTDLVQLVQATIESLRLASAARRIHLQLDTDVASARLHADPLRIAQVVTNLVNNALKFSPAGSRVRVRVAKDDREAVVTVADEGVGIEPEFLPHVFERFRQQRGGQGGLGLGMAISKHIVDEHGGVIAVSSDGKGKGTTFTVHLPLLTSAVDDAAAEFSDNRATQRMQIVAAPRQTARRLQDVAVLVVEDDVDSLELLELTLLSEGADVSTAATAAEGRQRLDDRRVDVIVSDLALGDEDGYSFMRSVRQREDGNRDAIAIATSGFVSAEDRAKAIEAGFATHMAKPFDIDSLVALIARMAPRPATAAR